jgi:hypothetical protein
MNFGRAVLWFQATQGVRPAELARRLGVSRQAVFIMQQKKIVKIDKIIEYSEAFGVHWEEFMRMVVDGDEVAFRSGRGRD